MENLNVFCNNWKNFSKNFKEISVNYDDKISKVSRKFYENYKENLENSAQIEKTHSAKFEQILRFKRIFWII